MTVGVQMQISPRSPMGSSVSVPGSKMDTTVFSMGMPTLPGLVTLPAATVAAEATSVMP